LLPLFFQPRANQISATQEAKEVKEVKEIKDSEAAELPSSHS